MYCTMRYSALMEAPMALGLGSAVENGSQGAGWRGVQVGVRELLGRCSARMCALKGRRLYEFYGARAGTWHVWGIVVLCCESATALKFCATEPAEVSCVVACFTS